MKPKKSQLTGLSANELIYFPETGSFRDWENNYVGKLRKVGEDYHIGKSDTDIKFNVIENNSEFIIFK